MVPADIIDRLRLMYVGSLDFYISITIRAFVMCSKNAKRHSVHQKITAECKWQNYLLCFGWLVG